MPKYLFKASYTTEGIKGAIKDGGTARKKSATHLFESLGGSVESFYFAFGDADVYVIADLPDNVSAAAGATAVSATGAVSVSTTVLLTAAELDEAFAKTVEYRPPGA